VLALLGTLPEFYLQLLEITLAEDFRSISIEYEQYVHNIDFSQVFSIYLGFDVHL
jgi:hypothetical protein